MQVATEYGGAYGDQSWRDAEPQYPEYPGQPIRGDGPSTDGAQPPAAQPPAAQPPAAQPPAVQPPAVQPPAVQPPGLRQRRRRPASTALAATALVLGLLGLIVSVFGVATQVLPRRFTGEQQQQIVNWEFGRSWRLLSAGAIFPASVSYLPPNVLDDGPPPALALAARRIGIAKQATCRTATDAAAAAVLVHDGCSALLRATYTDATNSYVVTVGVAVLPSTAQAATAASALGRAAAVDGIAPGVHAVAFKDTAAAWFTDQRRQLSGSTWAGTYVALYTVGYADSRPREPVSGDAYAGGAGGEMTSVGLGVARAVLAAVGAPVPTPHCPGTPGC